MIPVTSPDKAPTIAPTASSAAKLKQSQRRALIAMWIRKTHGWVGLWGAVLGMIFGTAGFWLNHRAVLKIPVAQQRSNIQLALPTPAPATAEEMAVWLRSTLKLERPPNNMRVEHEKPAGWMEKGSTAAPLMQPERWVFQFGGPNEIVQAEYWKNNRSVSVTTTAHGFVSTLTNMHKGTGMSVGWIFLVDTFAGSILFLSISGVILWMLTNRRRAVGIAIFSTSLLVALGLIVVRL